MRMCDVTKKCDDNWWRHLRSLNQCTEHNWTAIWDVLLFFFFFLVVSYSKYSASSSIISVQSIALSQTNFMPFFITYLIWASYLAVIISPVYMIKPTIPGLPYSVFKTPDMWRAELPMLKFLILSKHVELLYRAVSSIR